MKVKTERIGKGIASKPAGAKDPVQGGRLPVQGRQEEATKREQEKRRISKDLIGEPRAFA